MTSAGDIWVYELRRDNMMRLTIGGGYGNLLWSADGRYIAFRSAGGMFWTRADGTGDPQQLTQSKDLQIPWSFSANGKRLAFVTVHPASGADLWTMPVESNASGLRAAGKAEPFLQTSFNERSADVLSRRAVARLLFERVGGLPGICAGVSGQKR